MIRRFLLTVLAAALALAARAPADKPAKPVKPDFVVSADAISKEVFADEKKAAAKYEGKVVQIDGPVMTANKMLDPAGFSVEGGKKSPDDFSGYLVRCSVPKADLRKAWALAGKQKVSATGRVESVTGLSLTLSGVAVKELEPAKVPEVKAEALAAEYAKSGDAARAKKYLGEDFRCEVVVTGVVAAVAQAGVVWTVTLAGQGATRVACTFDPEDVKKLRAGDRVTVEGYLSGFDEKKANSPTLSSAFLVKNESDAKKKPATP